MSGNWGLIAGVAGLIVSVITIVSVIIAIGQNKGKTDAQITTMDKQITDLQTEMKEHKKEAAKTEATLRSEFKEEASKLRTELAVTNSTMQDFGNRFSDFSGEMRATMNFIKDDLRDIKEKVNAKEK